MVLDAAAARPLAASLTRAALAALLAGLLLAACGSDRPRELVGADGGPLEMRLADCEDWASLRDERDRLALVQAVRAFAGGPVGSPAGHGATLSDGRAVRVFDARCAPAFARGFKLYKLYTRAAAFSGR